MGKLISLHHQRGLIVIFICSTRLCKKTKEKMLLSIGIAGEFKMVNGERMMVMFSVKASSLSNWSDLRWYRYKLSYYMYQYSNFIFIKICRNSLIPGNTFWNKNLFLTILFLACYAYSIKKTKASTPPEHIYTGIASMIYLSFLAFNSCEIALCT